MNKVLGILKKFLGFAAAAAPVAAEVAKMAGNDEVVGDINKAEAAARIATVAINQEKK